MLNKKIKLLCAVALMLGAISIASAGHYRYYNSCCCKQDPYSKFATCYNRCSDYPQQVFPLPSP
ncbi:MAG TPA: hypothetical protein VLH77_05915 [Gammaproteobacteria bacterium]|nr:hypothetical protein [Gammaproteobacteria bacterium]